jgi:FMN phosphatase YigB (HAD superfamily)
VTTLLFDLDGTLLDIDMPAFLKAYFSLAGRRFASPPGLPRVTPALAAAMRKMTLYRAGKRTLDRVFLEAFSPAIKRAPIEVRGAFSAFHHAEFEQLRRLTAPRPAARPLLELALALGYELAIVTNPVFLLDAIRARIRWAGLEGIPFTLVTCAEIMRCAKPHQRYFAQILRLLHRRAEECLMIGDDPGMDLPAGLLGVGTWLVIPEPEECLAVAGADFRGTLEELAGWLAARGPAPGGRTNRGIPTIRPAAPPASVTGGNRDRGSAT